ncbi:hypothetical protein Trydic_g16287 [Trypoxylus dichotomus]
MSTAPITSKFFMVEILSRTPMSPIFNGEALIATPLNSCEIISIVRYERNLRLAKQHSGVLCMKKIYLPGLISERNRSLMLE